MPKGALRGGHFSLLWLLKNSPNIKSCLKKRICSASFDLNFRNYHSEKFKLSKKKVWFKIVHPQDPTDGVKVHFMSIATK